MLDAEHLPGAAPAGLHLVGDEDAAGLADGLGDDLEIFLGRNDETARADDHLGQDSGDPAGGGGLNHFLDVLGAGDLARRVGQLQRTTVAVRRECVREARHRAADLLPGRLPRGGDRHHRAARVSVPQHQHLLVAGMDAGQEHRRLVRLGPRVGEERAVEAGRKDLRHHLGEIGEHRIRVEGRGMHQGLRLTDDRLGHLGMTVPDADRQHAPEAVEVRLAGLVPDMHPLAAHQRQRRFVIGRDAREEITAVLLGGGGGDLSRRGPLARFMIRHDSPS